MRRTLLAATLCVSWLTACGDDSTGQPASTQAAESQVVDSQVVATQPTQSAPVTQPSETTLGAPEAPEVLRFAAPLLGGGSLDFTQYAGRTVAMWFWAPT